MSIHDIKGSVPPMPQNSPPLIEPKFKISNKRWIVSTLLFDNIQLSCGKCRADVYYFCSWRNIDRLMAGWLRGVLPFPSSLAIITASGRFLICTYNMIVWYCLLSLPSEVSVYAMRYKVGTFSWTYNFLCSIGSYNMRIINYLSQRRRE